MNPSLKRALVRGVGKHGWRGLAGFALAAALGAMLAVTTSRNPAEAQTSPSYAPASGLPSFRLTQQQTSTISPTDAQAYYGSSTSSAQVTPSPRIAALARALENDPDRIYQFVRNSIAYEPQFGLHKGADGVLLDGAGGAFDQAQLMVHLLRAAGKPARYAYGVVSLGSEAQSILRTGSARQTCLLLASTGMPATVNGQTGCGGLTGAASAVQLLHVWVEASIDGNWYAFDPSLKANAGIQGVDLAGAMGASGGSAWSNVASGVSSGQTALTGVNASSINTKLTSYATALQNTLAASHGDKSLTDIVGGWRIQRDESVVRQGTRPNSTVTARWDNEAPAAFRATVQFETAGFNQTLDLANFYAHRTQGQIDGRVFKLAVRICEHENTRATAYFRNGGTCQTANTYVGSDAGEIVYVAAQRVLKISINHPYAAQSGAFADESVFKTLETGKRAEIVVRTAGGTGSRSVLYGAAVDPVVDLKVVPEGNPVECHIYNGPAPNTPMQEGDCMGTGSEDWQYWQQTETMFPTGEIAAAEMSTRKDALINLWTEIFDDAVRVLEPLSGARVFHQHTLGVALTPSYGENVLDVETSVAIAPTGSDAPHQILSALAAFASANEAASLYQAQVDRAGTGVISATENASRRMASATALTVINAGGSSAVLGSNVTAPVKAEIDRYLANQFSVIAAQMPSGRSAFMARRTDGSEQAWIIGEGTVSTPTTTDVDPRSPFRKGAAADAPKPLDFLGKTEERAIAANVAGSQMGAVDLRTGALSFSEAGALSMGQGEFPYSLSFGWSYSSTGPATGRGLMGAGWTHNWDSSAQRTSDLRALFPEAEGVTATPTIVAMIVALEAGRADTIEASFVSGVVMNWWQDQAQNNVISVNGGGSSARFVRLPNGSWRNPAAPAEALLNVSTDGYDFDRRLADQSVQVYRRVALPAGEGNEAPGPTIRDRSALKTWTFPTGVIVTLTYGDQTYTNAATLKTVSNNLGVSLNFTHSITPDQPTQNQCMGQARAMPAGPTRAEEIRKCARLAQSGGRLMSVRAGPTGSNANYAGPDQVAFGYQDDCNPYTSHCTFYLISATRPGLRVRSYEYAEPTGALEQGAGSAFGYQQLLTAIKDETSSSPLVRASFTWNALGGLVAPYVSSAFDAQNRETRYYSSGGALSSARDMLDNTHRQVFDPDGRLTASSDPEGRTWRQTYDGAGRSASVQSPWGDVTSFKYDERGNMTERRQAPKAGCGSDPWKCQTIVITAEYHTTWNKPTRIIQPAVSTDNQIREWTLSYNAQGLVENLTAPQVKDGVTNQMHNPVWHTDYDSYGRVTRTRDPTGVEVLNTYGMYGVVPAFCLWTTKRAAQSSAVNMLTTYGCNQVGDVISSTDARNHTTTFQYDSLRRKRLEIGPAGTNIHTEWVYDIDGYLTQERRWDDSASATRVTTTTYSATGKPLTVTDPSGDVTRTCYDVLDRVAVVVDPTGRATRTLYNNASQPVEIERWWTASPSDPACARTSALPAGQAGHTWRAFHYNDEGLQIGEQDANDNITETTYDGLGRAHEVIYPDRSWTRTLMNERGQVVMVRQRNGETQNRFYDAAGRLFHTWETDPVPDGEKGRHVRIGMDQAGRTVWKDVSSQENAVWDDDFLRDIHTYVYDPAGQLYTDTVRPNNGAMGTNSLQIMYAYDWAGNRTLIKWPNNRMDIWYSYDAANRVNQIGSPGWVNPVTMTYDSLGRRTSLTRPSTATTHWAYEPDGDLASVMHGFTSNGTLGFTYQHDAAGRVIDVTSTVPLAMTWQPWLNESRTYGVANNLNQVSSEAGGALTFNENGNLTGYQNLAFGWTYGNRLKSANRSGMNAQYAYDADDRRTTKVVNGVMTRTLWSDGEEIAQYSTNGTLLRIFVPDGSGALDSKIAVIEYQGYTPTYHWLLTDHQGSVIGTMDNSGIYAYWVNYSPWGELGTVYAGLNHTAPPLGSPFGYTGREYDAETGLWQYRARYYQPRLGQFLSTDPIGMKDDPNLYMYVANDPVNATDPTGEQACETIATCAAHRQDRGNEITPQQAIDSGRAQNRTLGPLLQGAAQLIPDPVVRLGVSALGRQVSATASAPTSTLRPGPYADRSIPARSSDRNFTAGERAANNENMAQGGCHTCGTRDAGTKSGNAVPDHQPPSAINPPGGRQELYPQCLNCSTRQMREVRQEQLRQRREGQ